MTDFDSDILSHATGFQILGANQEPEIAKAKTLFSLTDTATDAILHCLNGPTFPGTPFLAVLQMKRDGRHEHLLYNTIGPIELRAFSTTPEDVGLRRRLSAKLGAEEARHRLAASYSNSSAKDDFIRRITALAEQGSGHRSDPAASVVPGLANEIINANTLTNNDAFQPNKFLRADMKPVDPLWPPKPSC